MTAENVEPPRRESGLLGGSESLASIHLVGNAGLMTSSYDEQLAARVVAQEAHDAAAADRATRQAEQAKVLGHEPSTTGS